MLNNNDTCITCQHFAWWDGDYCCMSKMKVIQHGDTFSEGIEAKIKPCEEFSYDEKAPYKEEYKRYQEWQKQIAILDSFVK